MANGKAFNITETEPDEMSEDEYLKRMQTALEAFTNIAYSGINKIHKEKGKPSITLEQAKEGVLYWAKNSKD